MHGNSEQRVRDDVERHRAEDAVESPQPVPVARPAPPDPAGPPDLVVAGVVGAVLLVLLGALVAGLSVGIATALGWALWRCSPRRARAHPTPARSVWAAPAPEVTWVARARDGRLGSDVDHVTEPGRPAGTASSSIRRYETS